MAFNIDKDYGEVIGLGSAKYFQDGKYFDVQGKEVKHNKNGEEIQPQKRRPAPAAATKKDNADSESDSK